MTTDPFGADSPFGDQPETPDVPTPEELLGVDGDDPGDDAGLALDGAADLDGSIDEDLLSALPGADDDVEDPFADITEFGEPGELAELEDDDSASWLMEFDLDDEDFDPDEALEEALRETADQDEYEPAGVGAWIGRALLVLLSVGAGVVGAKYLLPGMGGQPATTDVATNTNTNTGAPTTPPAGGAQPNAGGETPVAGTTPNTAPNGGAEAPNAGTTGGPAAPNGQTTPNKPNRDQRTGKPRPPKPGPQTPPSIAVESNPGTGAGATAPGGATPPAAGPGETAVAVETETDPGVPTIEIEWDEPGSGRLLRETTTEAPTETATAPAEPERGLREASPEELAGIWTGTTIPIAALRQPERLLTPGVGRVRVILAKGEVFEGKLYAVGQRKLWLETNLGKMALVDWQIDRIEHIVASDGTLLSGGDSSKDMAGLPNVRVRTAGGVFYGKMLSRDGSSVVLVTESGGRVTLDGAEVELAGRAATHVVDASGAESAPATTTETEQ